MCVIKYFIHGYNKYLEHKEPEFNFNLGLNKYFPGNPEALQNMHNENIFFFWKLYFVCLINFGKIS